MAEQLSAEQKEAALASARLQGCTCDPDFIARTLAPLVIDVEVQHDDWCPLYQRLRARHG